MTVNERLFNRGLLPAFDSACRRREFDEVVRLLLEVELSAQDATACAQAIFDNPSRYGY